MIPVTALGVRVLGAPTCQEEIRELKPAQAHCSLQGLVCWLIFIFCVGLSQYFVWIFLGKAVYICSTDRAVYLQQRLPSSPLGVEISSASLTIAVVASYVLF